MSSTAIARTVTVHLAGLAGRFRRTAEKTKAVRVQYVGPHVTRWAQAYPALEAAVIARVTAVAGAHNVQFAIPFVRNAAWYVLMTALSRTFTPIRGQRVLATVGPGRGPTDEENYRAVGEQVARLPWSYRAFDVGGFGAQGPPVIHADGQIMMAWSAFVNWVLRGFQVGAS